jgi:ABC-type lipoprotein export system ATPase subunit
MSAQPTSKGSSHGGRILYAERLFKSYKMGAGRVQVLKGADLSIKSGEFLAVVGASGSGKSTLLHILGALDKPDRGSVKFEGSDLSRLKTGQVNRFRNSVVGFVFQFYHLLDELTVLENVMLPAMVGSNLVGWVGARRRKRQRAAEILERLGLNHRIRHRPYELSGGERQRVAIGRALMNEPKLLLADEPTGNLDSATGNDILDILEDLTRRGQTIVMVTHDQAVARRATRVVTLADGVIK